MQKFQTDIRVRYKETDQMGVVYHSNYFVWFEIARTEFFRKYGFLYKDIEKQGLFLMVIEADCKYLSPATYDDLITVDCWIEEHGRTSLVFKYSVKKENKLLAEGKTVHVFTDKNSKPVKIPDNIKEKMLK